MKYIVEIGCTKFSIEDMTTAVSFAEIAHTYRVDKSDKVRIELVDEESEDKEE